MTSVEHLFRVLDTWRHLPAYQLERRADVFFSLYLRGFLAQKFGVEIDERIIPEFPVRSALVGGASNALTERIDYVATAQDRSRVFFVELKTDPSSRNEPQDATLKQCEKLGLRALVVGLRDIRPAGESGAAWRKEYHLFALLEQLGFLSLPPGMEDLIYSKNARGLSRMIEKIQMTEHDPPITVVYLQPDPEAGAVCFDEFASYVASFDDNVSRAFAHHLRRWRTPAGSLKPRDLR